MERLSNNGHLKRVERLLPLSPLENYFDEFSFLNFTAIDQYFHYVI